jgi:hypothetical protein
MSITFETARLAREKGLFYNYLNLEGYGLFPEIDLHSKVFYNLQSQEIELLDIKIIGNPGKPTGWVFTSDYINFINSEVSLYAPLQSELQKWLREFHNIDITVYPIESKTETRFLFQEIDDKQYGYYISIGAIQQFDTIKLFSTYEEALEQGLQESLNLLK